jgi:hypothetical protein
MYQKITTWFLALSMFLFGVLKFVHPFKGWYTLQISTSGLPAYAYPLGILGEISVGILLFICLIFGKIFPRTLYLQLTTAAFFLIILMMLTGTFVHLHPDVPAEVLPLKIKPPYIPIFFLLLSISNIYITFKPKSGLD